MRMETSDPTHTSSLQLSHILFHNFAQMYPPDFIFLTRNKGLVPYITYFCFDIVIPYVLKTICLKMVL